MRNIIILTSKRFLAPLLLFVITFSLTGCWMLEKVFLVPEMDAEIPFNTVLTNKEVLDAIALAAHDAKIANPKDARVYHNMDVTYLNVAEGVLETGRYSESNVLGIRLRAEIKREEQLIDITVKGVDIYYSRIPLDKGLQEIQMTITQRLTEAVAKNKK